MARMHVHVGSGGRGFGRWLSALLLLAFTGVGLFALYAVAVEIWRGVQTYAWEEARCTVLRSEAVEEDDGTYRYAVTYRWRWQGARYSGSRYRPGYASSDDVAEPYRLAGRYPAGAEVPCFVDPDQPTEATLERWDPWRAFIVLVPLAFVAVGGGGLWMLWRLGRGQSPLPGLASLSGDASTKGTGSGREAKTGTGCLVAFFSVFLLAGLGFMVPFFVLPVLRTFEARDWRPVPATVLRSEVGVHPSDEGDPTYSVDVVYRYEVDGREYRSGRYDFMIGSTGGYEGKAEIVQRLPAGTETTAWVDPEDPASAVLSREMRGELWLGLLPGVFVAVGLGGIVFVFIGARRMKRRQEAGIEEWRPEAVGELAAGGGGVVLEPKHSPLGKLVGGVLIALFWNGIVGVFVWKWWEEAAAGSMDGCLTLFLIPFVLVGVLLLVNVPYQVLALFNPRPVLTLDGGRLEPGCRTTVSWRFRGSAGRIRHLKVVCRGREEATYRQGTDTVTKTSTFAEIVLADTTVDVARGSAALHLPEDTMHSFEADHNKIAWSLHLHGTIDRWPDVMDEHPLVVHPKRVGG